MTLNPPTTRDDTAVALQTRCPRSPVVPPRTLPTYPRTSAVPPPPAPPLSHLHQQPIVHLGHSSWKPAVGKPQTCVVPVTPQTPPALSPHGGQSRPQEGAGFLPHLLRASRKLRVQPAPPGPLAPLRLGSGALARCSEGSSLASVSPSACNSLVSQREGCFLSLPSP